MPKDFKINLRLEANVPNFPPLTVPILQNFIYPIPICNKKTITEFPFLSWADFKKNVGAQAGEYVWEATKKFLGLEDVIDGNRCSGTWDPNINKQRKFSLTCV